MGKMDVTTTAWDEYAMSYIFMNYKLSDKYQWISSLLKSEVSDQQPT